MIVRAFRPPAAVSDVRGDRRLTRHPDQLNANLRPVFIAARDGDHAIAQAVATGNEEAKSITLTSKAWGDIATPRYAIAAQPQHGTLSAISGGKVTYTPNAGYAGQ